MKYNRIGLQSLVVFITIIYMYPQFIEYVIPSYILGILASLRYLISGAAMLLYFIKKKHFYAITPVFLYQFSVIFFAFYNNDLYLTYALSCMSFIGFVIINVNLFDKYGITVVNCYYNIITLYLIFEYATLLLPNGLVPGYYGDNKVFFLGTKNQITLYYVLFVILSLLRYSNKKIGTIDNNIVMLVAISALLFLAHSSTVLIVLSLTIIYLMWLLVKKRYNFPDYALCIVICLLFVAVVLQGRQSFVAELITSIFGKSSDFNGRGPIWSLALEMIRQNPLGSGLYVALNPWANNTLYVYSAHNTILDIAVRVGLIPSILFILLIVYIITHLNESRCQFILRYFLLCVCLASMMEANQSFVIFWLILSICISQTRNNVFILKHKFDKSFH